MAKKIVLTDEQKKFLIKNNGKMTLMEMEVELNISRCVLTNVFKELGITKIKCRGNGKMKEPRRQEEKYNVKEKEYEKFVKKSYAVKRHLEEVGKLGQYTLIKAYKDKALLMNKKGHKTCLTYQEIVLEFTHQEREEEEDDHH